MKTAIVISTIDDWREADGITHPAAHHADEVFATVMLATNKFLTSHGMFTVYRTRDVDIISKAKNDGKHIVYDVGGEYDAEKNLFDHHQLGFEERREPRNGRKQGTKYASAGLIWRQYGPQLAQFYAQGIRLSDKGWENVARTVDELLIEGIDAFDNGEIEDGVAMSVSTFIQMLNTSVVFGYGDELDNINDFMSACQMAEMILIRTVMRATEIELDRASIIELLDRNTAESYLVLDRQYSTWREAILSLSGGEDCSREIAQKAMKVCFCIFPRADGTGQWCIQAVPPNAYEMMKQRESFPSKWRGLKGNELAAVSGVADAIFCHVGGFFASAKTLKGAKMLATLAHVLYNTNNT